MTHDVSESGFTDRGQNYTQKMYWVVAKGDERITIELNGSTNFGRKHLLLPSQKATKLEPLKKESHFDEYVEKKNANRAAHRGKATNYSNPSSDDQKKKLRWFNKYHSGASTNTSVNLVTSSKNSIDSKAAAVAFADAIRAAKIASGQSEVVEVNFGRECVLQHKKDGTNLGTLSALRVLVKCVGDNAYEIVHKA